MVMLMSQPRRTTDAFHEDDSGDFIVRRRILPVWQLLLLFFLCFTVLFVVTTNAELLGGSVGLGLAIFAVIGPLTWFTVYFSQQNRDMLLAAEFQNALFSAAARLKTKFVMIVKQDGTIFYYDRGFQKVFPETGSRGTLMIDKIFSSQQIAPVEAEKLYRALEENHSATVFIHLPNEQGEEQKVIITVDPLPRPNGFFIVRGRDYVVKRYERSSATQSSMVPIGDNPQLANIASHMLHTIPYGLYTTDAEGNILFMNYRMETWLGYNQNEAASRKLSLINIIPQQNTATAESLLQRDCEGEVQFKSKDGRVVQLHVQQEISKDASGKLIGSVAVLRPEKPLSGDIVSNAAKTGARQPESGQDLPTMMAPAEQKKF